ncbi:MAG: PVC-type heme-binding CxxCH protein, partial [Bacteroidota bacterium]
MRFYFIILLSLIIFSCKKKDIPTVLTPELTSALASMEVMEGFKIELFAAEPLIADPVAMEIDEGGNVYVVEMHGYPLDLGRSGIIKKLVDTNGDGQPDNYEIFADSLLLPTGIMRWKKGFIVTDAPDVLYLEDTDNDGKADVKETLITGFALSNPQHNLNSPSFGIDNWIYLGHESAITPFVHKEEFGDKGTNVKYNSDHSSSGLGINANGRMVRFKPDSHEMETLSGETQFGHTTDPWGHRIYTSNAHHLFHEALAAQYIEHNPHLLVPEATQNIPDHGDAAKIFPITENPNHQLLTDVGVITSSCGVTWYKGGIFGEPFDKVTFIAEPVHNLVHADIIVENGASFTAKRLLEGKDFLASKDPWSRPVNFYVGPDGALYVIDYYRQIIEHPEWMSEEVNQSGALYNGTDKGRIYRISPSQDNNSSQWMGKLTLGDISEKELVEMLDHPNDWYRRTAQRLLFHTNQSFPRKELEKLLTTAKHAEAKVPAMWLLHDKGYLSTASLIQLLHDATAGVRENALKVAEVNIRLGKLLTPELKESIFTLSNDTSPKVRYQLLCTTSFIEESDEIRNKILAKDHKDSWVAIASIAASAGKEEALLDYAIQSFSKHPSKAKSVFFANLGATIANTGNKNGLDKLIHYPQHEWWKEAALSGVSKLWQYKSPTISLTESDKLALLNMVNEEIQPSLGNTALQILASCGFPKDNATTNSIIKAEKILTNQKVDTLIRANAITLLSIYEPNKYKNQLLNIVEKEQATYLKIAALQALQKSPDETVSLSVINLFSGFNSKVKNEAIKLLISSTKFITLFLKAVENNQINKNELGWRHTVSLLNYYDEDIRNYARELFAVNEDRKAVLQEYLPAIDIIGNAQKGKVVFEQFCKSCHLAEGIEGIDFGPNLTTLKSRNPHSIITEIIHPNNSIADQYELWEVALKNGNKLSGIIEQDTPQQLVLKQMNGEKLVLQKENISKKTQSPYSAMPNGLENGINVDDMADLV